MTETTDQTLNDDLDCPARMAASELPWSETESDSVRRKRLERDASSPPRVTSIVEYATQSRFPGHRHPLGEEFLVLQGEFADQYGRFPAGSYVRNPPGSSHVPFSDPGCIIMVKLQQMHPDERGVTVVDALGPKGWEAIDADGSEGEVSRKTLYRSVHETVFLYELQPGAVVTWTGDPRITEWFVVEGGLEDADAFHGPWTWLRNPSGAGQQFASATGAVVYVKRWGPWTVASSP